MQICWSKNAVAFKTRNNQRKPGIPNRVFIPSTYIHHLVFQQYSRIGEGEGGGHNVWRNVAPLLVNKLECQKSTWTNINLPGSYKKKVKIPFSCELCHRRIACLYSQSPLLPVMEAENTCGLRKRIDDCSVCFLARARMKNIQDFVFLLLKSIRINPRKVKESKRRSGNQNIIEIHRYARICLAENQIKTVSVSM